jgi:hypothetical protein
MNNLNEFPLNFTKENKSFIFWYAMLNAKHAKSLRNGEHQFNYWINIAFENFEIKADSLPNELDELLSFDLNIEKNLNQEVEDVYSSFSDQLAHDNKSKEKINSILEHHYLNGFSFNSNDTKNTTTDSSGDYLFKWTGLIALSSSFSVDHEEVENFERKAFTSLNDENLKLELAKKHESDLNENRKGMKVFSIYEQVCKEFTSKSKHFQLTLTGYIAASFNFFDSEEEHNESSRTGSYRYYLRQNVKSLIKTFET